MATGSVGASRAEQSCASDVANLSMPAHRFVDHGDGTVSDQASKLMWTKCVVGQASSGPTCSGLGVRQTWASAQQAAVELNRSGRLFFNDWRVPSVRELASITERGCRDPRTNLAVFPGTPPEPHWTSSGRTGQDAAAYMLSFGADGVRLVAKDAPAYVRLVRHDQ